MSKENKCKNCRHFGELRGTAGKKITNICLAPSDISGKRFVYRVLPNNECELFSKKEGK